MSNTEKQPYTEEFVSINGIDQYLMHSSVNNKNQIMLFVHGGPGAPSSIFAYAFQNGWENIYTVVHWDQRGSGKTLIRNPHTLPTFEQLLDDLVGVVAYLKKKYATDKVVILGHSWGTVLATEFVMKHPEDVDYYIAVSQVVNKIENERIGYEKVKELVEKANDKKAMKKLVAIGNYPGEALGEDWLKKNVIVNNLKVKYGLSTKPRLATLFKSPVFGFSDFKALIKGSTASKKLINYLAMVNFSIQPAIYKVPVYYIFGENDWQTPLSGARKYFDSIKAPDKRIFTIPYAGHMPMFDQPSLFFDVLETIHNERH
ncbi:MAG: alpha/beta fold hydrolase [Patescibacteria group bacterium]